MAVNLVERLKSKIVKEIAESKLSQVCFMFYGPNLIL